MISPLLKSTEVPWPDPDPEIRAALSVAPEDVPKRILIRLLRELDRRHMQLQDKVRFEKLFGLVDYSPLLVKPHCPIIDHGTALAVLEVKYDSKYGPLQQHHVTVNQTTEIRVRDWPMDYDPNDPPLIEIMIHQEATGAVTQEKGILWLNGVPVQPTGLCINVLRYRPTRINGVNHTIVDEFIVDLQ